MKIRIKKNLINLEPYLPDAVDFAVRLNANESPYNNDKFLLEKISNSKYSKFLNKNSLNRYPDPTYQTLINKIAKNHNVKENQIILSNGSDELISYLLTCLSGKTNSVLTFNPTFSMYEILSKVFNVNCYKISLDKNFDIPILKTISSIKKNDPDIIFIASPNNPSGNDFSKEKIREIIDISNGLVVIDEAYSDYSNNSFIPLVKKFKNLAVMKTMSKIGFASLRVGYLISNKEIINALNKVKLPYNVSTLSTIIAQDFFDNKKKYIKNIEEIKNQRDYLFKNLLKINKIKPYPSNSNFIFIYSQYAAKLSRYMESNKIKIKTFNPKKLKNYFRVTIGEAKENKKFLKFLYKFFENN